MSFELLGLPMCNNKNCCHTDACSLSSWELVALTMAVTVTTSPGTQVSTRSPESSQSIVRGILPASLRSSSTCSCNLFLYRCKWLTSGWSFEYLIVCESTVLVRLDRRKGEKNLPEQSLVGHCVKIITIIHYYYYVYHCGCGIFTIFK